MFGLASKNFVFLTLFEQNQKKLKKSFALKALILLSDYTKRTHFSKDVYKT